MEIDKRMKYSKTHEWVLVEGNKAKIGVSDYAQQQLTDIVFVELPEVNTKVEKGKSFGVIESVKAVEDVYAPITGKVLAKNQAVIDTPEIINNDPYNAWLIEVSIDNPKELDELMDAEAYKKFLESESH
ncbi:MAG: glycine cleavage system protein GcvH [Thermoplasmata archaeon]|jgi:glycine cleavage system H protein|nr:glycine cleavage system protein GcvH [Thermoplasmata archaeon]MVT13548.1 glycine cleavage system protein GcvH [Euryarchaeota archaeon]MVT14128.1 glycine cleavage system protein GcvH [Euryarchaeota archaeon]MVT35829.1 glycine cleavage system protein GcvH [Euryarchaeota archaeon]